MALACGHHFNRMAKLSNHPLSPTTNSALITILTAYNFLQPFSPVQADFGGPKCLTASNFLPVSISGKCLLVLYTPQNTVSSKQWVTEFTGHSWSHNIPMAIFKRRPREPRPGSSNYYKTCNVIAIFTEGFNTLPRNALRIQKQMLRNDYIIITDHLSVSQNSFSANYHVLLARERITQALIDTRILTVPENVLFIMDQFNVNTSHRSLDLYLPKLICTPSYLCLQKIPLKTAQLKISPTKTLWAPPVKTFGGYHVVLISPLVHMKDQVEWKEIHVATLRDIVVHRGLSMHPVLSAPAKEISEMAAKLNFSLIETSGADYDKHATNYYAGIPAVSMGVGVNGRTTGWDYSARSSLFQTFLYCTDKKLDGTNLLAFFNPFGPKMWLCLAMSFLGLCCFVVFSRAVAPGYAVILILTPLVA